MQNKAESISRLEGIIKEIKLEANNKINKYEETIVKLRSKSCSLTNVNIELTKQNNINSSEIDKIKYELQDKIQILESERINTHIAIKNIITKITQRDQMLIDVFNKQDNNNLIDNKYIINNTLEINDNVYDLNIYLNETDKTYQSIFNEIREKEIILNEKSKGFPWLAEAISNYHYLQNEKISDYLITKPYPAYRTSELLSMKSNELRVIEKKLRIAQSLIKYYYTLFPFLEDFTGNISDDVLQNVLLANISEKIDCIQQIDDIDPVDVYVPKHEYCSLSRIERYQMALDRYWNKRKTNWQIGRDYERYIGYLYEVKGYKVNYHGIFKGYDDLGRDVICSDKNRSLIIQCKYWSKHKTIHENCIMQLYGSTIQYCMEKPGEKVDAILYTTTNMSETAKKFASYLHIKVYENHDFDKNYPSIKCNVSRTNGEMIYHLPFDQQYDNTIIEPQRGECYIRTVEEAEKRGFRRAWRWHGE